MTILENKQDSKTAQDTVGAAHPPSGRDQV
jgi:hypothetical protein